MNLIGDVKGKDAMIIDDMIDTAGTLVQAAERAQARGARRDHGLRRAPGALRPGDAAHRGLAARGGRRHEHDPARPATSGSRKIKVLRWRRCSREAIRRIHDEESVSTLFV